MMLWAQLGIPLGVAGSRCERPGCRAAKTSQRRRPPCRSCRPYGESRSLRARNARGARAVRATARFSLFAAARRKGAGGGGTGAAAAARVLSFRHGKFELRPAAEVAADAVAGWGGAGDSIAGADSITATAIAASAGQGAVTVPCAL